ncbi:transporter [Roseomonas sp. GC11]|uniref:SphA family protein n=1 Tax=Roseomonas sp. GC11 TaxID=2950546 RepID=UPI00210964C2|nr:transporter [Roseomonas sp. GC11]MCQ4159487.1 transporter [Roseomonas sp. GC11]
MKKKWRAPRAFALGCALVLAPLPLRAAENATTNYPLGTASGMVLAAFPPMPGLFALSQSNVTTSAGLYDGSGNKAANPSFRLTGVSETVRLLASWPAEALGAHLYSMLVVPYVHLDSKVAGHGDSSTGFSNITLTPLLLNWRPAAGHSIGLGFDIATRTGRYKASDGLNTGTNYTTYMPVLTYRYRDPQGPEMAVGARYLVNSTNDDSRDFLGNRQSYRSGQALMVEFDLGYNFGRFRPALAGGYLRQTTGDRITNAVLGDGPAFGISGQRDGNKLEELRLGPSLTYDAGPFAVNLNYQRTAYVRNGSEANAFWFNIALPLWVPGHAAP